jgi:hypothetical protein
MYRHLHLCAGLRGDGAVDFLIENPAPEEGDFDTMARLGMKFGGASLAKIERIRNVARHIAREPAFASVRGAARRRGR